MAVGRKAERNLTSEALAALNSPDSNLLSKAIVVQIIGRVIRLGNMVESFMPKSGLDAQYKAAQKEIW
jgi:hypothetical protein